MRQNKKMMISVLWLLLGIGLTVGGILGLLDEFWSGMGGGFLAVGVLQLVRRIRYQTNESYREAVDTAKSDERYQFLANKAWAWAGYLFVMIGAVGVIVFRILGMGDLSTFCGGSVCLILVLYWLSYVFLRKKY